MRLRVRPAVVDHGHVSLLTALSAALLLGAALVGGGWAVRRVDGLGRPRAFPVWSVAFLLVVALVAAIPGARRRTQERRLGSVASRLVGHHVNVHCQSNAGALVDAGAELGYVKYDGDGIPEPRTTLKREPCHDLRRYVDSNKRRPTLEEVVAVHVLTHEAMHMRGETNEATAECEAVQRDAQTARMLGATERQAQGLARYYWQIVYPDMPDDYRTSDCAPGGGLDEGLPAAPWGSAVT